jgi:hypothetical protein
MDLLLSNYPNPRSSLTKEDLTHDRFTKWDHRP